MRWSSSALASVNLLSARSCETRAGAWSIAVHPRSRRGRPPQTDKESPPNLPLQECVNHFGQNLRQITRIVLCIVNYV